MLRGVGKDLSFLPKSQSGFTCLFRLTDPSSGLTGVWSGRLRDESSSLSTMHYVQTQAFECWVIVCADIIP